MPGRGEDTLHVPWMGSHRGSGGCSSCGLEVLFSESCVQAGLNCKSCLSGLEWRDLWPVLFTFAFVVMKHD